MESIQKKLLRVRPPRVRITYDVETGGAMEKKELPFIVGILADLSGDRETPDLTPALKDRRISDIDRDNFNDFMKKTAPRVALNAVRATSPVLEELLKQPADHTIVFGSLDDFDPMNVIDALPSLKALYESRSQMRTLQTRAEADDQFADNLDTLVNTGDINVTNSVMTPAVPLADAQKNAARTSILELQTAVAAAPATPVPADTLVKWGLLSAKDQKIAALTTPVTPPDTAKLAAAKAKLDTAKTAGKTALDDATKLVDLLVKSKHLAATTDDAAIIADAKKAALAVIDGKDIDAQVKVLTAWSIADLPAAADVAFLTAPTDSDIAMAQQCAVQAGINAGILAGLFPKTDDEFKTPQGIATLNLATFLSNANSVNRQAIINALPLLQNDATKVFIALNHLAAQVVVSNKDAAVSAQLKQARENDKGAAAVIDVLVARIDRQLSAAVSAILHAPKFKEVEATWRGLHYLIENTETGAMLKLRVLNVTKEELRKDMMKAVEFDQSALFKMVYEAEYGTYGGFPYSLLIGAYELGGDQVDIDFLKKISEVAASAHAPFIASASNKLFGLTGFEKLDKPRDLRKIFEGAELINWRSFRESEDARYVSLVLPRALLRLPYGKPEKRNTIECEAFQFEEIVGEKDAEPIFSEHGDVLSYPTPGTENFLWGNAAFMLAERITNAFSLYSWTAAIRGVEGGGLVENLPVYTYTSDAGTTELFCPTEVSITDRREKELNDLGFISLCHCKGTGKAAFFGGQTTNLPKKYFSDEANANARISAMLPYMLAASRFAHYIKVIMREKIGSFLTRANVESYLNTWIANYVLLDDNASQEVKSSYPLRSASVVVTEVPGEPGSYKATVFIKPHFQLEELTTSIRLVANLPK